MNDRLLLAYDTVPAYFQKKLGHSPIQDDWPPELQREHEELHDRLYYIVRDARSRCPYCSSPLRRVELYYYRCGGGDRCVSTTRCTGCGWWYTTDDLHEDYVDCLYCPSVLVNYSPSDPALPVDLLLAELVKKSQALYKVSPSGLEKFVGEVLRNVYDCDVLHVGRTGDGGIDLVVLNADGPIAVQVKRRTSPDKIEQIALVREFLGAMVLKNYRHGIFVTTARCFTKGSRGITKQLPNLSVDRLDLWDVHKLVDIYRMAVVPDDYQPWRKLECYSDLRKRRAGLPNRCVYTDDPKSCA